MYVILHTYPQKCAFRNVANILYGQSIRIFDHSLYLKIARNDAWICEFFITYHFPENWVSSLDIANLGNLKVISLKKSSIKEIYNKGFCLGPQKLTYL